MAMNRIYLDYAASAPLAPEAKKIIQDFVEGNPVGNPSSLHREGRKAQALLDKAHTTVASVFGVHPTEVIFTSGATESNNLAIRGVLQAWKKEHTTKPHVVMSAIEHSSWRQTVRSEDTEVTIIPVSKHGVVSAEALRKALRENTALVGCMYVNNEIGTIQPIPEIGKAIEEFREERKTKWPVFHVDAVQAFPYLNTHSGHVHADTLTLSGHKYGALSGIGALLIKKNTPLDSIMKGGAQEWGYRGGTENVLGAITFSTMIDWHDANRESELMHVENLQDLLESSLIKEFPEIEILAQKSLRAPHITYVWLPNVIDEHIVQKLDLAGVAVSSGSACSSGATLPSSTLLAMGFAHDEAFGGLRISYGRFTTKEEIQRFIEILKGILDKNF